MTTRGASAALSAPEPLHRHVCPVARRWGLAGPGRRRVHQWRSGGSKGEVVRPTRCAAMPDISANAGPDELPTGYVISSPTSQVPLFPGASTVTHMLLRVRQSSSARRTAARSTRSWARSGKAASGRPTGAPAPTGRAWPSRSWRCARRAGGRPSTSSSAKCARCGASLRAWASQNS